MSSGINLSTLRCEAEGEDLFGSWSSIILALVDAVEAAHKHLAHAQKEPSLEDEGRPAWEHNLYTTEQRAFDALSLFDFEAA